MQTIDEWEKDNGKPYPEWAQVWHYDAYGESWGVKQWYEVKDFYESERKIPPCKNAPMWQYYFEPMVALPTDERMQWSDERAIPLKRI